MKQEQVRTDLGTCTKPQSLNLASTLLPPQPVFDGISLEVSPGWQLLSEIIDQKRSETITSISRVWAGGTGLSCPMVYQGGPPLPVPDIPCYTHPTPQGLLGYFFFSFLCVYMCFRDSLPGRG